jgi:hypothetical protein
VFIVVSIFRYRLSPETFEYTLVHYIASNDKLTVNDELESPSKEVVVAYLNNQLISLVTEENLEIASS